MTFPMNIQINRTSQGEEEWEDDEEFKGDQLAERSQPVQPCESGALKYSIKFILDTHTEN